MLLSITINNYTLVDSLEIEFSGGTTAITGETGAGKSLILDALSMALGDRADTSTIRHGKDRAQITTNFDISCISEAKKWLEHNDFSEGRRVHTATYIPLRAALRVISMDNPAPCNNYNNWVIFWLIFTVSMSIQSLLRRNTHRKLLDKFNNSVAEQVAGYFQDWQHNKEIT